MVSPVEIIYFEHSGFAVNTGEDILVFDYFRDPAGSMEKLLKLDKKVWVFSSHSHEDHFNRVIGKWQKSVAAYILSDDIKSAGGLSRVSPEKLTYMAPYETKVVGPLQVSTYGSTDLGVSFSVKIAGLHIFYAGDLNWWRWPDDTPEEEAAGTEAFKQEMDKIAGGKFDIAFFPVDSRLEQYRELGATEFCLRTETKQLVAMHYCGEIWNPPTLFPGNDKNVSVWCPKSSGDKLKIG